MAPMHTSHRKVVALIAACLTLCTSVVADPLQVVYFEKYEPISWSASGDVQGVLVDIINEAIGRRMGIEVSNRGYPWARAQEMVRDGRADAFVTVATSERTAYTVCSNEDVLRLENIAYVSAANKRLPDLQRVQSIDDLLPFTMTSYFGNGWAKERFVKHNVEWVYGLENSIRMLGAGRVDVFVEARQVVRYHLQKMGLAQRFVELEPVFDTVRFRLCIRKDSPLVDRLTQFDQSIRTMRMDGAMRRIYEKYVIDSQ